MKTQVLFLLYALFKLMLSFLQFSSILYSKKYLQGWKLPKLENLKKNDGELGAARPTAGPRQSLGQGSRGLLVPWSSWIYAILKTHDPFPFSFPFTMFFRQRMHVVEEMIFGGENVLDSFSIYHPLTPLSKMGHH